MRITIEAEGFSPETFDSCTPGGQTFGGHFFRNVAGEDYLFLAIGESFVIEKALARAVTDWPTPTPSEMELLKRLK